MIQFTIEYIIRVGCCTQRPYKDTGMWNYVIMVRSVYTLTILSVVLRIRQAGKRDTYTTADDSKTGYLPGTVTIHWRPCL